MKRSKRASQSHTVRDDPPGSVSRHRFSPYIGFYVKPVYLSSRSHLQKRLACLRARSSAETPRQESRVIITKFLTSKVHPEPTVLIPLPPPPLSLSCRFFALSSFRLLFLLALGLALVVCVDTWRNQIWPKIKGSHGCRQPIRARLVFERHCLLTNTSFKFS